MNAVLDTNILVSALLTPAGSCAQILDLIRDEVVQAYLDARVFAEYEDVLLDPRFPFTRLTKWTAC